MPRSTPSKKLPTLFILRLNKIVNRKANFAVGKIHYKKLKLNIEID